MEAAHTQTHTRAKPIAYVSASPPGESMAAAEEFERIYEAYFTRVYKYVCYRINNRHSAEDMCSQVFETVMAKYGSYAKEKGNFEVWLFAIARNCVTDYFRAQKRRAHYSLDSILNLVFPKPSPEELAIRDDNNRELFEALARLRAKERHIIAMKYGAGLKNSEIAALLGVSESNIGVVVYRSLRKLQQHLSQGGFNNE
jgi:RNA polymerase sigma-70 factor (ECF subfamily)